MKRTPLIGIVVVLALGGAGLGWRFWAPRPAEPHYQTAKVERGPIAAKVSANGTLSALVTVQVGSQVSGRLQSLMVDFNSPVRQGQLLAKLDPQMFQAALERERANFATARGSLHKAEVEAENTQRQAQRASLLAERHLIAQADLESAQSASEAARTQVEMARANLQQAQASLKQAELNLTYTSIVSPVDGIVISRAVDVGQTVAASLQAPTLFVIAQDLKRMQVDTSVSESDIGHLQAGMPAVFTVDAFPGQEFKATIRQIRNAPQTVQNIVTYDAVLDVANPDLRLRPGMTANVSVTWSSRDEALRIPNAALRVQLALRGAAADGRGAPNASGQARRSRGGRANGEASAEAGRQAGRDEAGSPDRSRQRPDGKPIWVERDGKPERLWVKTGLSDGTFTEVLGDRLQEGERVITDMDAAPAGNRSNRRRGPGGLF